MLVTIDYRSEVLLHLCPPLPSDPTDVDLVMNAVTDWRELKVELLGGCITRYNNSISEPLHSSSWDITETTGCSVDTNIQLITNN